MTDTRWTAETELYDGELVTVYGDVALTPYNNDEARSQLVPMISVKPDDDRPDAYAHMTWCGCCLSADELIVSGGKDDGVWRCVRGQWRRVQ